MRNQRYILPISLSRFFKNNKVLVIQSDDWGSIRMPSSKIQKILNKHPLIDANDAYALNDTLESKEDIESLCNVLSSFKDSYGNPPQFTANNVMGNPDFSKIREAGYREYYFEDLRTTFASHQKESALDAWKKAEDEGLFHFQFHGREHVNVRAWLRLLRDGHEGVLRAFEYDVFGVRFQNLGLRKSNFQAAWDYEFSADLRYVLDSIEEGMDLFEDFFGYKSRTAIAPSYAWSKEMEDLLRCKGVNAMQTGLVQKLPNGNATKFRRKYRIYHSCLYQVRNAYFEPTLVPNKNVVENCLNDIENAFRYKRPAIISAHRVNFIGGLNLKNRDANLVLLKELLTQVLQKWPEIQFVNSTELFYLEQNKQ